MRPPEEIERHLRGLGRVLLGYSGGVDSALLAVLGARALGSAHFLAAIGRSPSYPEAQWDTALDVARRFDVPLISLETRELDDPRYVANTPDRCYFCKTELWTRLGALARERGFTTMIDGTNADDLREHRPGLRAGTEHAVRSPLAELGWRKEDVRAASRTLGLPTWDAPAAPCLSSRVRYGLSVTPERLRQVEAGEAFLRSVGVTGDLRVRHLGETARIETAPDQHPRLDVVWERVRAVFAGIGFTDVMLDPAGYRRGALLTVLADSRG
jgi:pyridinium-3,5-biscarboxylic acid mononucleotide sulfurtransferase